MALKTVRTKHAKKKRGKQRRGAAGRPRLAGAHAPGATPLTADDLVGLKLPATTHGDLNALEAENIRHGWRWAVRSTTSRVPNMLTEAYLRELHRRMFGEVWSWAGENRTREVNVGVDPTKKAAQLLADLLLVKHFKRGRLPWGGDTLDQRGHRRDEYIAAVRRADAQDYTPLMQVSQSST